MEGKVRMLTSLALLLALALALVFILAALVGRAYRNAGERKRRRRRLELLRRRLQDDLT